MATKRKPDWQRVGDAVLLRRSQLGYRRQDDIAAKAGVGVQTWRQIEGGKQANYSVPILVAVAAALGWPPDMLTRIANGEDPPPASVEDDVRTRLDGLEDRMGRLEKAVDGLVDRARR